jgi:hypothetical protein
VIIGLTHEKDGRVRVRRTVTTKVAIGLPPDENSNYPKKLDHFVFLKKVKQGKEVAWEVDRTLQDHYGEKCTEFWVVFLDDDPETVLRNEYAAYLKRGCWCKGDGEKAVRRDLGRDGKQWGEFKIHQGPCANNGCKDFDKGDCKPSGDLSFMLADFPSLGSICRWHTSSYQSIQQVYSALQDLRRITGGRLMGVAAKLFIHEEKNVFEQGGVTKVGTKFVVGLELRAQDLAGLQSKMLETAKVFAQIKGELNGQVLEVEEDDEERGSELTPEFYPTNGGSNGKVLVAEDPEKPLREQADKLLQQHYPEMNAAKRQMQISRYQGRMPELIEKLRQNGAQPKEATVVQGNTQSQERTGTREEPKTSRASEQQTQTVRESRPVENIHGVNITDDDLPSNLFESSPREGAAPDKSSSPDPAPASRTTTAQKGAWSF